MTDKENDGIELTGEQRGEIDRLFIQEGYSEEGIAQHLGISKHKVKAYIKREGLRSKKAKYKNEQAERKKIKQVLKKHLPKGDNPKKSD